MDFLGWTAAVGGLLLLMSLASGWINRGPLTVFGLYLIAGIICGPWMLDLLHLNLSQHAVLVARTTEIAMATSLFITGLKLRLPFSNPGWRMGIRLAFPAMILTVAGITVMFYYITGFAWPLSLAFGAPTDPVLASLISVNDANDDDSMRVSLSSETSMNDGTALPVLMLAMALLASKTDFSAGILAHWALKDILWALLGGLGIGFGMGRGVGKLAARVRNAHQDVAPNDFFALVLIALSYAAAQGLDASGFLAAFAAGVGLRRAEVRVVNRHPPEELAEEEHYPPAEILVNPNRRHTLGNGGLATAVGLVVGDALSFGDTVERLFAAAIVVALGISLAYHWDPMGLVLAAILFVVIRPLSVWLATLGTDTPPLRRLLIGWLGIRGIGSVNYIAYAFSHGLADKDAERMVNMALTLIVASVIVHGITVTPLLNWRQARQTARQADNTDP